MATAVDGKPIWQIGKFDQSPSEFAARLKGPINFVAESMNPATNWPGKQKSGETFQITFQLNSTQQAYTLRLAALIEQPRIPAIRLGVNGHKGIFYLHPKLSYSRGDFTYAFDPHEATASLNIPLPTAFMVKGQNVLTIECVDEPATPAGETEVGGIAYDALALLSDAKPSAREQPACQITLEPTIFFYRSGAALTEVVDGFLRFNRPWKAGELVLAAGGEEYKAGFPAGEFGERRVALKVKEWTGTMATSVRVSESGATAELAPQNIDLTTQRKWTLFVVPHAHLDVGFTDYQGKVAEIHARILSTALEILQQHPDFRFSMDGSWNLEQFLDTRPLSLQRKMFKEIQRGRIALPAQYCNLLTGYASLETLTRSLYYSKSLSDKFGLPYEYANITDVPTYSGSYPSVLAAAGIKYWAAAANNDRAPIFHYKQWNELSPFWWQGPDGGKVLFWYSRHYQQTEQLFGQPPQFNAIRESLPVFLQAYNESSYKPNAALLYGTQVENSDLVPGTATFATEWNKQYAFPVLQYATFPDFFRYLEANYAADLPTVKADGSGYWEDGIGSDAFFTAVDRRNQNRVLAAETLASVMHTVDANLNPPSNAFREIWRNIILYAEHTWLSHNAVSQPAHDESVRQARVKDSRAEIASLQIEDVSNRSLGQLADRIHIPAASFVVFNPLNWRRDVLVELDVDDDQQLEDVNTGSEIPLQVLTEQQHFRHVRFLAENLPPVGYKCYRLKEKVQSRQGTGQSVTAIENRFYRLRVNAGTGAIASIIDKQIGRELVDKTSPYQFGQYLYVTGGDGETQMINPFPALAPGKLTVHAAGNGRLVGIEKTSWGTSVMLESSAVNTPKIRMEVLLFDREKKIEFRYRLTKNYTLAKEAVYIAFPAAANKPQFRYSSQQGWVDAGKSVMTGGSLEWFNVQQWMAVSSTDLTVGIVPVDTFLASFGDINRGKWPGSFEPKSSTMFSYIMNNYWHTNYQAGQGGDFTFRYVITSGKEFDGGGLSRLGLEATRPILQDSVVDQDKVGNPERPLPASGQGFLSTSAENIALVTWKAAENGEGSILRLAELAGKQTHTSVRLDSFHLSSAKLCSGVETDLQTLPVRDGNTLELDLQPFQVRSVRIIGTSKPSVTNAVGF